MYIHTLDWVEGDEKYTLQNSNDTKIVVKKKKIQKQKP